MNKLKEQVVFNNLERALASEEKQGFTNAGVMGGFHAFLSGIVPRLEQLVPDNDFTVLRTIAKQYHTWSPAKRSQSFSEIRTLIKALKPSETIQIHDEKLNGNGDISSISNSQNNSEHSSKGSRKKRTVSLQYLKGVGPERAKQLQKLGIESIEDLLLYYPRRYEERNLRLINELKDGEIATVIGRVAAGQITRGRVKVVKLSIEQNGRSLYAVWFNQTFILKQFPVGTRIAVTGKVRWQQRTPEILVTDAEKAGSKPRSSEILPVYSETAKLSSKVIRNLIRSVIGYTEDYFAEIFPKDEVNGWMERTTAHQEIHFPSSNVNLKQARDRLVWEEILFLQLAIARLRKGRQRSGSPILNKGDNLAARFLNQMPFRLTDAQERVIREIFRDMAQTKSMARLIQGDVGSGKTVVAMAALLQAVGSGYQGAMMAPTEVLALQHFQTLKSAFAPLGIKVVSLLGSANRAEREETLKEIKVGTAQIIVGTHALIQQSVEFNSLGLAVTDEQHRFGVRQRSMLQNKGENPHVLVMTATPIPRTLALTLYGDLQISVLNEMPIGRKPVVTKKITERARPSLEKFMEEQIVLGRQVYVVCPLVEESETLDIISAEERAKDLEIKFSDYKVALLHGRMKGSEKEQILNEFQSGHIDILVSTTVVEVGVNIPNATVMVIEGAERFGLAQLHQLRGRVGRGSEQSYCILVSKEKDSRRLDILCRTQDGFKIAEEDLRLRGSGELLGTRQHGVAELKLADLARDGLIIEEAYQMVQKILNNPEKFKKVIQEVERIYPPEKIGLN